MNEPALKHDAVDKIMRYEAGEMEQEEMVELFQELIDSGLAWQLQGHYGRTAAQLIEAGACHSRGVEVG